MAPNVATRVAFKSILLQPIFPKYRNTPCCTLSPWPSASMPD